MPYNKVIISYCYDFCKWDFSDSGTQVYMKTL